ncbi:poly(A) polymerase [Pancytospora epiphaga]|nr:poly(A) polymerase [Pancytospora epiphaga]
METSDDLKHGVTGIVSAKESDKQSHEQSKKLQQFLCDSGFFESEEFAKTRERVLGKLDFMVKSFVKGIPGGPENPGGKIFTFGSYRLGVHDCGADIDALCVVPRHVSRKDFFSIFFEQLQNDSGVEEITKVEDSYVPLIKMKFYGIPIDVTFARLGVSVIRDNINLLNDTVLRSMDEKCIVSLNGSRVTDAILSLVPSPGVFHDALRAVKLWAKRRLIYGATYGYFGGVAYAICVARVCQMYPFACSFEILKRFFEQFSVWKWPAPVLLRPVDDLNYHLKVWNPKVNPVDRYHKMPVITPAYPAMCSTHNVTQSTAAHITSELVRGNEVLKGGDFTVLFEPADFTKKYKLFLEITASANEEFEFLMWSGFVESKLRTLAGKLEGVENILAALIVPKSFKEKTGSVEGTGKSLEDFMETNKNINKNSVNVHLSDMDKQNIGMNRKVVDGIDKEEHSEVDKTKKDESTDRPVKNKLSDDGFERVKVLKREEVSLSEGEPRKVVWFIALNVMLTNATNKKLYIDGPIRDFLKFMDSWEHKTEEMKIKVNPCKRRKVQSFMKGEGVD